MASFEGEGKPVPKIRPAMHGKGGTQRGQRDILNYYGKKSWR